MNNCSGIKEIKKKKIRYNGNKKKDKKTVYFVDVFNDFYDVTNTNRIESNYN